MWRLIAFILICAIFLVFVVLNLENSSDVSLGFRTFADIPVFLTAFSAFVLGMLFAIPFVLSFGKRRKKPSQPTPCPDYASTEGGKQVLSPRKSPGAKKKDSAGSDSIDKAVPMEVKKEDSPYGID